MTDQDTAPMETQSEPTAPAAIGRTAAKVPIEEFRRVLEQANTLADAAKQLGCTAGAVASRCKTNGIPTPNQRKKGVVPEAPAKPKYSQVPKEAAKDSAAAEEAVQDKEKAEQLLKQVGGPPSLPNIELEGPVRIAGRGIKTVEVSLDNGVIAFISVRLDRKNATLEIGRIESEEAPLAADA